MGRARAQGRPWPPGGRGGNAVMSPVRPLPQSFDTWIRLAHDDELVALAKLVTAALERRGYVPRCEWVKPEAPRTEHHRPADQKPPGP